MNSIRWFSLLFFFSYLTGFSQKPDRCILVFGAHADDVESLAGGTFAKYIDNGYRGIYVCVVNNFAGNALESVGGGTTAEGIEGKIFTVSGSPLEYPADALETMQIRSEEAIAAAVVFGAETPVFFDFHESFIWIGRKRCWIGDEEFLQYDPPGRQVMGVAADKGENINLIVELLKKYKPEIVITHTTGGEKHEHGNCGYLMYNAFKSAMSKGVPVGKLWMAYRGWVTEGPNMIEPDVKVDVAKYVNKKYEALNKHVSQTGGVRNQRSDKENTEWFITVLDNTRKIVKSPKASNE